eukprot:gene57356-biopygen43095
MPVALTTHIDRARHLLKGTEGILVGLWLDPEEETPLFGDDGEAVLQKQPVAAMVQFPHVDEPVKVPLQSSRWCLNPSQKVKRQQVWITRKHLPLVPACIACTNRGHKRCNACGLSMPNDAFGLNQQHKGDERRCKKCMDDKHTRNWKCAACGKEKQREEFAKSQLHNFGKKARCLDCLEGHGGRRGSKA